MNALMYHDVVAAGDEDASGFPGGDAALYKVTPARFDEQVAAIARLPLAARPVLTFDDGGASAMHAAGALERRGLRGYFFITANYIGTRGFVTEHDVRELHARGHVIGSHSCSHPLRMSHCSPRRLRDEWTQSCAILGALIDGEVTAASIPGGGFSLAVAEAAEAAGLRQLFTSEPTTETRTVRGLMIEGRFTIRRRTSVRTTLDLATGAGLARARQKIGWSLKKTTKRLTGSYYLEFRRLLLGGTLK